MIALIPYINLFNFSWITFFLRGGVGWGGGYGAFKITIYKQGIKMVILSNYIALNMYLEINLTAKP